MLLDVMINMQKLLYKTKIPPQLCGGKNADIVETEKLLALQTAKCASSTVFLRGKRMRTSWQEARWREGLCKICRDLQKTHEAGHTENPHAPNWRALRSKNAPFNAKLPPQIYGGR